MANIGTSEQPKPVEYDVFLCFRGTETRKNFTSCLYHDLVGAGIHVFRDDDELLRGKEIGGELLHAIANSRICMPVLSPNFATSAWCLREVAHMVECRQNSGHRLEILPIFYNVDAADVKLRTGSTYEVHANQHRDRFKDEDLHRWKDALKEVAKIKGWSLNDNTDDGELIKSIIHDILIKLRKKLRYLPRKFIERKDEADSLMKLIDVDSPDVRYIVIHGMGGIGKTTLAKVVFNQLYFLYEGSSFLESVREGAERHGHPYLQQKFLSDILNHDFTKGYSDISQGINDISARLCTKKVLIVIDDVDKDDQLKNLAGESCWFGCGTRIIITTRNLQVLPIQGEVDKYYYLNLQQMEFDDALCLFSWHAFGKDCPPDEYHGNSTKIVTAMGCHPLALEVIGSSLFCRCCNPLYCECSKIWEETLKELNVLDKKVEDMLMISINMLNFHQKQIFLDIACALVNEDKTNAIYMWDDCGYSPYKNIKILAQMSLIRITKNNKLWMHDTLIDLGRQLICKESLQNPCNRVWNEQEAKQIICKKQGMESIEVLFLNLDLCSLRYDALVELKELRLLRLRGKFKEEHRSSLLKRKWPFDDLHSKLRWLYWQHLPADSILGNLYLSNLVVLELYHSNITECWQGWGQLKIAKKLKVLDLTGCKRLERTPDFSNFILLERLILKDCKGLRKIDPSIGMLTKLTYLNMEECFSLMGLPEEIGSLTSLTTIIMKGRGQKFELPNLIGNLRSLTSLRIQVVSIAELPESIGELTNLIHLSLEKCQDLKKLPESIRKLKSLVELNISESDIIGLPDSIKNLEGLKVINMSGIKIGTLPATLGQLRSLEEIYANGCANLKGEIPMEICGLSSLEILDLYGCKIAGIPKSISNLSNLKRLYLDLSDAFEITNFRWISKLTKLEQLRITSPYVTTVGDDLACLIRLEKLRLSCPYLQGSIKLPLELRTLSIKGDLFMLEPPSNNAALFPCNFCDLDELHLLINLRRLFLGNYHGRFSDLSKLKNLTHLHFYNCDGLVHQLQGLGELQLLQDLRICSCDSLAALYGFSILRNLKLLIIKDCKKLKDVEGVDKLTSLVSLVIRNCPSLEKLANVSALFDCQLVNLLIRCPKLPFQKEIRNLALYQEFYFKTAQDF